MGKNENKPAIQKAGLSIEQFREFVKIMSKSNEKKIIRYLKGQLEGLEEDLKVYEIPIKDGERKSQMHEIEEIVLRKRISHLKGMVKTIELMVEVEEE